MNPRVKQADWLIHLQSITVTEDVHLEIVCNVEGVSTSPQRQDVSVGHTAEVIWTWTLACREEASGVLIDGVLTALICLHTCTAASGLVPRRGRGPVGGRVCTSLPLRTRLQFCAVSGRSRRQ